MYMECYFACTVNDHALLHDGTYNQQIHNEHGD